MVYRIPTCSSPGIGEAARHKRGKDKAATTADSVAPTGNLNDWPRPMAPDCWTDSSSSPAGVGPSNDSDMTPNLNRSFVTFCTPRTAVSPVKIPGFAF
jgi:hypothetical protein